jgi:hypothetical protein
MSGSPGKIGISKNSSSVSKGLLGQTMAGDILHSFGTNGLDPLGAHSVPVGGNGHPFFD